MIYCENIRNRANAKAKRPPFFMTRSVRGVLVTFLVACAGCQTLNVAREPSEGDASPKVERAAEIGGGLLNMFYIALPFINR